MEGKKGEQTQESDPLGNRSSQFKLVKKTNRSVNKEPTEIRKNCYKGERKTAGVKSMDVYHEDLLLTRGDHQWLVL